MKKATRFLYFFITLLLFFSITACGGGSVTGKYYQYDGETKNEESWFELKSGNKWTDNDGLEGRFEIKGDTITFYYEEFGEEEELMSGTLKDGVLTFTILGMTSVYKKDGATGEVGELPPYYAENKDYLAQESKSYSVSNLTISNGMVSSMNYSTFSEELYLRVPHDTSTVTLADYIRSSQRWDLCEDKEGKVQISNTVLTINPGQRKVYYIFLPEVSKSIKLTIERKSTLLVSYYDEDGEFIITHHYRAGTYLSVPSYNYNPSMGYSEFKWAYYDSGSYKIIEDYSQFTPSDGLKVRVLPVADEYNVTLNPDGGNIYTSSATIRYNAILNLPIPEKEGHTFLGWFLDNIQYTDDNGQGLTVWRNVVDTTLQARYSVNEYEVFLNINNNQAGTIGFSSGETYDFFAYGSTVTAIAQTTTNNDLKDEYIFLGWFYMDECLSEEFEYTFVMPATTMHLEARWSTKEYSITYYLFDGTNAEYNPETYTATDEINLENPTKEGYTFGGWYDNEDFTGEPITSIPLGSKGNMVLYARWYGADEATQGLSYSLYDGGYVVKAGYLTSDEVVIPGTYSGQPVIGIGSYGFSNSAITSIVLPETIQFIENYAFSGCSQLTSIVIPDSVQSISAGAFKGCPLESIVLPFVGESLDASNYTALFGHIFGNGYYEGSYAARQYYEAQNYTIYYIPESLKTVTITGGNLSYGSFYACSSIETINLPATVSNIDQYTFRDCLGLKNIKIDKDNQYFTDIDGVLYNKEATVLIQYPLNRAGAYEISQGVTEIMTYAFNNCVALTAITIPDTVIRIGESAFMGCSRLSSITLPQNLQDLETNVFSGCENLETVNLNNSLTTIGNNAFKDCINLKSIVVPESVTNIGSSVFSGCSSLNEITLPFVGRKSDASQSISLFGYIFGSSTYGGSYEAQQFTYYNPSYLLGSTYYFFYIPSSLKKVTITGGTINYGSFFNCSSVETLILETVTEIKDYAFANCNGIKEMVFPDSITKFGNNIFYGSQNVEALTLPFINARFSSTFGTKVQTTIKNIIITGGTSIPENAFSGCTNLEKVVVPNSVTSIGSRAFNGCGNLKEITLPFVGARIDAILDNAVFGYIFGTVSYTGSIAVQQTYAENRNVTYYIPYSLTKVVITGGSIGYGAFSYCSRLTSITLPEGITSIKDKTFYNCTSLQTLNISEVTSIGNDALYECNALQYTVYEGLKYLGNWVIDTVDTNITVVNFRDNTVGIYDYAFANCTKITSVIIPETIGYIGKGAFSGCTGLTEMTLPFIGDSLSGKYKHFGFIFDAADYTANTIKVPTSLKKVIITGGTEIAAYAFYGCKNLTSVSIPRTVTSIGSSAFAGCSGLIDMVLPFVGSGKTTSAELLFGYIFGASYFEGSTMIDQFYSDYNSRTFYIPSSLRNITIMGGTIGYGAFYGCTPLESIVLPENLTSIGVKAFSSCMNLLSITIPKTVIEIGDSAFLGCSRLKTVNIPENSDLTTIGYKAFRDCYALEAIYIPANVGLIEEYTFYGCRKLLTVSFDENSILYSIGNNAFAYCTILESINIPAGVTWISDTAFSNSPKLIYEIYDGNVKYLGNWVFGVVDKTLVSASLKPQTIGIYYSAFSGCTNLTAIDIPTEVVRISNYAFSGCTSLQTVRFSENSKLQYLGEYAFTNCTSLEDINLEVNAKLKTISGYLFNNCSSLASITIPSGVTNIAEYAFKGCTGLASVLIPSTVTSIGNGAFYDCRSLSTLVIPDSATSIGYEALRGCGGLTELTLPFVGTNSSEAGTSSALFGYIFGTNNYANSKSTVQYYAKDKSTSFYIPSSLKTVEITGTNLSYGAFYNCSMIENLIINNMESIGEAAFYNCSGLVDITLSETITSIGNNAFGNCLNLSHVFSNNPTPPTMNDAFINNAAGLKIYVPADSVAAYKTAAGWNKYNGKIYSQSIIDADGFAIEDGLLVQYTGKLTDVVIPNTVIRIGSYAFSNIESVTMPDTVTAIENNAFRDCANLQNVNFGEGLVQIGSYAFSGCLALESIDLPVSLTTIGAYAFNGNSNLETVNFALNSQLSRIEERAFSDCDGLESITLPENLTYVGDYAFKLCDNLKRVYIESSNLTLGREAFEKSISLKLYVSADSLLTYQEAESWKDYLSTIYSEAIIDEDGFAIQNNVLVQYCGSLSDVIIPETVTAIGAYAFDYHIVNLTIPASVAIIHDYAFKDCVNLVSVVFEENSVLESVGAYAFADCTNLSTIALPDSTLVIGAYAFAGCSSLVEIIVPMGVVEISSYLFNNCSSLAVVILPNGLSTIGAYAFNNCVALETIIIPSSVISIASHAFSGCSGLTEMTTPFVGQSSQATNANALFGYIFGTTAYTGATAVTQVYGSSANAVYYIPSALTKVTLTGNVLNYGAFSNCTMLQEVSINKVTSIGSYAFSGCSGLLTVNIPATVKTIGNNAFTGCSKISTIKLPSSITSIGESAFSQCTDLGSVFLDSTTPPTLATGVFDNNALARKFYVPSTATNSYKSATGWSSFSSLIYSKTIVNSSGFAIQSGKLLQYTGTLTNVTVPSSVTTIAHYAFSNRIVQVVIPSSVVTIEDYALRTIESLEEIVVSTTNTNFSSKDGVLFNKDETILITYPRAKTVTTYSIPDTVLTIGAYAFNNNTYLQTITMPSNLNAIETYAFQNCTRLRNVVIPSSVNSLGGWIFAGCSGLTELTLPFIGLSKNNPNVLGTLFTTSSYTGSTSARQINALGLVGTYYLPSGLRKVTVNGGAIGYGTFYYCSMLTDINLNGVTSIDAMAFYYCSNFTLRVYNTTPPTLNSGALSNASSFSIYVPSSSVNQYKTRDVWKNYTNVIFGM